MATNPLEESLKNMTLTQQAELRRKEIKRQQTLNRIQDNLDWREKILTMAGMVEESNQIPTVVNGILKLNEEGSNGLAEQAYATLEKSLKARPEIMQENFVTLYFLERSLNFTKQFDDTNGKPLDNAAKTIEPLASRPPKQNPYSQLTRLSLGPKPQARASKSKTMHSPELEENESFDFGTKS